MARPPWRRRGGRSPRHGPVMALPGVHRPDAEEQSGGYDYPDFQEHYEETPRPDAEEQSGGYDYPDFQEHYEETPTFPLRNLRPSPPAPSSFRRRSVLHPPPPRGSSSTAGRDVPAADPLPRPRRRFVPGCRSAPVPGGSKPSAPSRPLRLRRHTTAPSQPPIRIPVPGGSTPARPPIRRRRLAPGSLSIRGAAPLLRPSRLSASPTTVRSVPGGSTPARPPIRRRHRLAPVLRLPPLAPRRWRARWCAHVCRTPSAVVVCVELCYKAGEWKTLTDRSLQERPAQAGCTWYLGGVIYMAVPFYKRARKIEEIWRRHNSGPM
ncbi:serine/arginine repetitive matrix protein 1-like [Panicum virgatum]|uniref:serine/arginine repetitive matrix protein 1-like n=1 Tax=Panicum virgatum TaxID=38727 RepID=UPI0019D4FB1C|nr:serine/arginine repetitive matrix protein 1-like [Panicum virgatum]